MIFGNQVTPPRPKTIYERLDDGDARMAAIEADLAANTKATQELAAAVQDVVAFFSAMSGALKALDMLGRLAKPLGYITAFFAAAVSFWAAIKSGHIGPR